MRLKIAYEIVRQEIGRIVQPRQVRSIRMNGSVVDQTKVQVVLGMLSAWAVSAVLGTTLIAIVEYDLDLTSVISVVVSCLGNTGFHALSANAPCPNSLRPVLINPTSPTEYGGKL